VEGVAALAGEVSVRVTGSRRTPGAWLAALGERLGKELVWSGEGGNPYPGMLGMADVAVVTADSVNMATEAASAGVPVLVAGGKGLSGKLRRFHEDFAAAGYGWVFRGRYECWTVEELREAERVAGVLVREYLEGVDRR